MKNRDLDNIYRQGFKDKEMTPPAGMWEKIAAGLPKEKPRRAVYPLWFPLVGAAAVLLLLFNIGLLFHQSQPGPQGGPEITNQEDPIDESSKKDLPDSFITTEQFNKTINSIVGDFEARLLEANNNIDSLMEVTNADQIQVAPKDFESGVAGTSTPSMDDSLSKTTNEDGMITPPIKNQSLEDNAQLTQNVPPNEEGKEDAPPTPSGERLAQETPQDDETPNVMPSLEEQLAFNELHAGDSKEGEINKNRFSISTRVAPIFFETGGGNIFDTQFSQHEASGEVSLAYGVNIAYKISDRIKLRSGLNKIEMGYNTQEVPYNAAVNSPRLEATSKATTMSSPAPGVLNQHLGFFELPLEMEYLLVDQRIGLSLLIGGSSLLLDENNLSLNSSVFSANLGEANNLNKTSFTTNFGVGINYKLTDQFNFNLEPIIKYQLNTFKDTDGNPYFFGLYTGFSFDF